MALKKKPVTGMKDMLPREMEIRDYRVDQLKFKPNRRRDRGNVNDAELKALEALEKKEGKSKLDDN